MGSAARTGPAADEHFPAYPTAVVGSLLLVMGAASAGLVPSTPRSSRPALARMRSDRSRDFKQRHEWCEARQATTKVQERQHGSKQERGLTHERMLELAR
jgi:hypothetical protein